MLLRLIEKVLYILHLGTRIDCFVPSRVNDKYSTERSDWNEHFLYLRCSEQHLWTNCVHYSVLKSPSITGHFGAEITLVAAIAETYSRFSVLKHSKGQSTRPSVSPDEGARLSASCLTESWGGAWCLCMTGSRGHLAAARGSGGGSVSVIGGARVSCHVRHSAHTYYTDQRKQQQDSVSPHRWGHRRRMEGEWRSKVWAGLIVLLGISLSECYSALTAHVNLMPQNIH